MSREATQFKKGSIPWNKKEPIKLICKECGKEFCVNPARKKTAKFCSISCHSTHKMYGNKYGQGKRPWHAGTKGKMPSGEDHYNWKNVGTERHRQMSQITYRLWRDGVFTRDNYTCQVCEQHGGYLHADHIKPWKDHEEMRFDVSNGRTLCVACHYYITFKKVIPTGSKWGKVGMARKTG